MNFFLRFVKDSKNSVFIVYLSSNIVSALIGFLMVPIVTRLLTPEEYGAFSIFQTFIAAFGIFVGLNGKGLILRNLFDENKSSDIKHYISGSMSIALLSSLVISVLLIIFLIFFDININSEFIFIALVIAFFTYLIDLRKIIHQGMSQPLMYSFYQIGSTLMTLIFVFVFMQYYSFGLDGRVLSALLGPALFFIAALYSFKRSDFLSWGVPKANVYKELLKFGIPMLPYSIFGVGFLYVDRWVVASKIGMHEVGLYSAAIQLILPITIFFDSLAKAYSPWLYRKLSDKENHFSLIRHQVLLIAALAIMLAPGYFILKFLADVIFPQEYHIGSSLFFIIYVSYSIIGIYRIINTSLFYFLKTKHISAITSLCFFIYIASLLLLVDDFGLIGVATSYLISSISHLLLTIIDSFIVDRNDRNLCLR
ncbi:oligosaccharide flippase family protein [Marinomonas piezotolerans]|uniref:oligosaccharide flippase family protein n=1 Tax=Marinomonas piezotolerans TaxID=2213058 RepID=UPI001314A913|nr:oligosaccharide flippase family protein [Marinomonas piezotolerans]